MTRQQIGPTLTGAGYFNENGKKWGTEESNRIQAITKTLRVSSQILAKMVELGQIETRIALHKGQERLTYPAHRLAEYGWLSELPKAIMLARQPGRTLPYEDETGAAWIDLGTVAQDVKIARTGDEHRTPSWNHAAGEIAEEVTQLLPACDWIPGRYAEQVIEEVYHGNNWYPWEDGANWSYRERVGLLPRAVPLIVAADAEDLVQTLS